MSDSGVMGASWAGMTLVWEALLGVLSGSMTAGVVGMGMVAVVGMFLGVAFGGDSLATLGHASRNRFASWRKAMSWAWPNW